MSRSVHASIAVLAAMLSPALLQPIDCNGGNPNLATLELKVFGQNQIKDFSASKRSYSVSIPSGTVTLRAQSVVPTARVNYTLLAGTVTSGLLGFGGGEVSLNIPSGPSSLLISVTDGGTNASYNVSIGTQAGLCGDGIAVPPEACDDGNSTSGDSCSPTCQLDYNPGVIAQTIPVVCNQNLTSDVFEFAYELTLDPVEPVAGDRPVTFNVSAKAVLGESFIDDAQNAVIGGVAELGIIQLNTSVSVRSGGQGDDVLISRGPPFDDGRCTVSNAPCAVDTDCGGQGGICVEFVPVPILDGAEDNCSSCAAIGKQIECQTNGYCADGPVEIPVGSTRMTLTTDDLGEVLLGWNEDALPPVQVVPQTYGPNGAAYFIGGLNLQFECYMGSVAPGGVSGLPLLDEDLIDFPIAALPVSCGDGILQSGEECDDGNTTGGDGCASDCTLEAVGGTPLPVVCSNNFTTDVFDIPYTLTIDPREPVRAGGAVTVDLFGSAEYPEFLLDLTEFMLPPGYETKLVVEDLAASVHVRSGAIAGDVQLHVDVSSLVPGPTRFCTLPSDQECTSDGECTVPPCGSPVNLVAVPTSVDCAPGGLCDSIGKLGQCTLNGRCITGGVTVPLESGVSTFSVLPVPEVLVGWFDDEDEVPPFPVSFGDPLGPNGSRAVINDTFFTAAECVMGTEDGTGTFGVLLSDSELISLPVIAVATTCGDGVVEVGEECDDNNTADGDGCASDCTIEPITMAIDLACRSNGVLFLPDFDVTYTMVVDPQVPVLAGAPFQAHFSGTAEIPAIVLEGAALWFGSLPVYTSLDVFSVSAGARSGASGGTIALQYEPSALVPGPTRLCTFPADVPCNADSDCLGPPCRPPSDLVAIPTSVDCSPGGLCDTLGKLTSQCVPYGACVTGPAQVPLTEGIGTFITNASGTVLLGWNEDGLPSTAPAYSDPPGANGVRIRFNDALFVAYECTMGNVAAGGTGSVPLPDGDLVSLPILN